MAEKSRKEFTNSDDDYLDWVRNHPFGYVLNTTRSPIEGYLVLHKARCASIRQYRGKARPGGFTEREYIKICADDIEEIENWVRSKGFSILLITQGCRCWKNG